MATSDGPQGLIAGEGDSSLDQRLSDELDAYNIAAMDAGEQPEFTVKIEDDRGDLVAGLSGWTGTVVVLAGQSHDTATAYSADVLAVRAAADGHAQPLPAPPEWVFCLRDLDPARVYFAHDHSVWVPS